MLGSGLLHEVAAGSGAKRHAETGAGKRRGHQHRKLIEADLVNGQVVTTQETIGSPAPSRDATHRTKKLRKAKDRDGLVTPIIQGTALGSNRRAAGARDKALAAARSRHDIMERAADESPVQTAARRRARDRSSPAWAEVSGRRAGTSRHRWLQRNPRGPRAWR